MLLNEATTTVPVLANLVCNSFTITATLTIHKTIAPSTSVVINIANAVAVVAVVSIDTRPFAAASFFFFASTFVLNTQKY